MTEMESMDFAHTLIELAKFAGLIALPFTVYLASKRIGYKVAATYAWRTGRLITEGISAVTLMNLKDRPVAIFEIHAIINGKSLSLKSFDPPLILKSLEAINIDIEPVSSYYTDEGIFKLEDPLENGNKIDFYLSTIDKNVKCVRKGPASHYWIMKKRNLKRISKHTRRYNGHIINDNARYALVYNDNGKEKTSFIDRGGFIHNWDYCINALPVSDLKDKETVRAAIIQAGFEPVIKHLLIVDLDEERQ